MAFLFGSIFGIGAYFFLRCIYGGFFTVDQNERAVLTTFGKAQRIPDMTTLDDPIAESLTDEQRQRYVYPQLRVIGPGGPYFKFPWQRVYKVPTAIKTVSIAYDPDTPTANTGGQILDAVTRDQLNIGLTGQLRYRVSERNIYAYLFGVKRPISHIMGYFVAVLRERIATFEARKSAAAEAVAAGGKAEVGSLSIEGVSINDLRKNLNDINQQMDKECASSAARYGMVLDASLITGIDPPVDIESALAAINTAHNEVSSDISLAQASADQKIVQSRRAVEIETMKAQAEIEPLRQLSAQLSILKENSPQALDAYLRNVRLGLLAKASRVIQES